MLVSVRSSNAQRLLEGVTAARGGERALAAPGTTSVPRADAAPPGSSTGEPIDAVGAELTDSSSDDEAEGG